MGAQLTHQPDLRFPENTAARLSIVVIDPAERTQCRTIRCSTTECKLQCKQKGPQKARKRPAGCHPGVEHQTRRIVEV